MPRIEQDGTFLVRFLVGALSIASSSFWHGASRKSQTICSKLPDPTPWQNKKTLAGPYLNNDFGSVFFVRMRTGLATKLHAFFVGGREQNILELISERLLTA